ncbi:MAG TPA: PEP-CTERM sorting domain-containing protein [Verrucomicrobiae bacterium]|nr:PEP-CTERM sorting domain-containing protein [Verrucomicrobiae bacterium]
MKSSYLWLYALGMVGLAMPSHAQTLYGATSGGQGELYILNPATGGVLQDVGALNDALGANYSVTGLAYDQLTGVLYGSTGGSSGHSLLTIDPATGLVTVVGSFNAGTATMTDLAFDPSGSLYGISSSGGANLYSINTSSGQATIVGSSGFTFTEGGGLAINSLGTFYSAPVPGEFGTYDPTTGAYTHIAAPGTPAGGGAYGALAFSGSTLFGDNLLPGSGGGGSHLVRIDPTTGTVTDIGASVTHLDALAVTPEPGTMAILSVGGLLALFVVRRKRTAFEARRC